MAVPVPSQHLNGVHIGVCSVLLLQTSLLCKEQASPVPNMRLTLVSLLLEMVLELPWILPKFARNYGTEMSIHMKLI